MSDGPEYSLSDLFDEYQELLGTDVIINKELYAHFGKTMYAFALLEHGMVNWLTYNQTRKSGNPTAQQFDKFYEINFRMTFGNLIQAYAKFAEAEKPILEKLNVLKNERNHIVHEFFRESLAFQSDEAGIHSLLVYLANVRKNSKSVENYFDDLTVQEIHRNPALAKYYENIDSITQDLKREAIETAAAVRSGKQTYSQNRLKKP